MHVYTVSMVCSISATALTKNYHIAQSPGMEDSFWLAQCFFVLGSAIGFQHAVFFSESQQTFPQLNVVLFQVPDHVRLSLQNLVWVTVIPAENNDGF